MRAFLQTKIYYLLRLTQPKKTYLPLLLVVARRTYTNNIQSATIYVSLAMLAYILHKIDFLFEKYIRIWYSEVL